MNFLSNKEININPTVDHAQELDHAAILEYVFALDQSDADHLNAQKCLDILRGRERDFIGTDFENEYWYAVSLELFHLAQNFAIQMDTEAAASRLREAIVAAEKSADIGWLHYIKGTSMYLANDPDGLHACIAQADENSNILIRLEKGLRDRGGPDYQKDCFGI